MAGLCSSKPCVFLCLRVFWCLGKVLRTACSSPLWLKIELVSLGFSWDDLILSQIFLTLNSISFPEDHIKKKLHLIRKPPCVPSCACVPCPVLRLSLASGMVFGNMCQLLDSFLCPLSTNSNVERDLFFTLKNLQAVGKFYVLLRK